MKKGFSQISEKPKIARNIKKLTAKAEAITRAVFGPPPFAQGMYTKKITRQAFRLGNG